MAVFEKFARQHKVEKIVLVLDEALATVGVAPSSLEAVRLVVWSPTEDFYSAATVAGVNKPSAETIAAVVKFYRWRYSQSIKLTGS